MKKLNILYILPFIMFMGCDDILDKAPLDTASDENFWSSENNVAGYANMFYEQFVGFGNGSGGGDYYFKTLSDDQNGNEFATWSFKTSPGTDSKWNNAWDEVRRANVLLERVDKVPMSDAAKTHWKGVGYLMRAWQYYKLVRMYGDVPWVDKPLDIVDQAYLYGPRVNRDQIMDKVLDDLNTACRDVNDNTSKITLNRAVAYAMKAEVCLYEGTFRKYRKAEDGQSAPDLTGALKYFNACKEACAAIMAKNYSLNASYQGNYNSVSLSSNPEMILYKAYNQANFRHSTIDYICTSTQNSGMTKNAFESYLFTDGKPLALTTLDKDDAAKLIEGKMSIAHMMTVRDKRLGQSIDPYICYLNRTFARFSGDMQMTSSTGYCVSKYDNGSIPIQYRNQTGSNYTHAPLFWLAVIYLNYAEACAELGTITQDDLNNSINKLKTRAGLPPLTVVVGFDDPANNHGVSSLIWEIRRERRCELMFDNWNRYWDLIRWHQLDKLDIKTYPDIVKGANIVNDPTATVTKVGNYMDGSKGGERVYDKKHYLYPLPLDQITLNPQLKPQNPGWNDI